MDRASLTPAISATRLCDFSSYVMSLITHMSFDSTKYSPTADNSVLAESGKYLMVLYRSILYFGLTLDSTDVSVRTTLFRAPRGNDRTPRELRRSEPDCWICKISENLGTGRNPQYTHSCPSLNYVPASANHRHTQDPESRNRGSAAQTWSESIHCSLRGSPPARSKSFTLACSTSRQKSTSPHCRRRTRETERECSRHNRARHGDVHKLFDDVLLHSLLWNNL